MPSSSTRGGHNVVMPLPWRVEMFGGLRVVQSDRTITRFQTQKTGALLAYLSLHKQTAHSREVLAEMLWPGADPVAVRNRLNQAASSLRRQLEPPGIIHGSVLITDQRTIRVNPESIETDVEEFTRHIARAESSRNPEDKQVYLKKAIDLYVGDFLSGHYVEWVTVEQLRFSDLYTGALFDLLDVSRDTGDADQAIRAATLLLKDDPSDEGTHCDLMRLYLDAGRPAAAKRQFEELTRILAAEQESPSEEAYELNREASAKRASVAKPMQVIVKEATPVEPYVREESSPGLPSAPNRFVGREPDLARLRQMLGEESTRLISITGMGGCGKTRLALQLAHDLSEEFDRNAFFVPLADLRDPKQIDEASLTTLSIWWKRGRSSYKPFSRQYPLSNAWQLLVAHCELPPNGAIYFHRFPLHPRRSHWTNLVKTQASHSLWIEPKRHCPTFNLRHVMQKLCVACANDWKVCPLPSN